MNNLFVILFAIEYKYFIKLITYKLNVVLYWNKTNIVKIVDKMHDLKSKSLDIVTITISKLE